MIQTTIRIPEKMYKTIKKLAKERGLTMNGFILVALQNITNYEKR